MDHFVFWFICLVWGTSFILMKKASLALGPMGVGCYRLLSGSAALLLIWSLRREAWPISRKDYGAAALIAVVSYAWPFAIQPYLVERHGSALMGMLVSLVPLLTVAVGPFMLKTKPTRREGLGVALGLVFLLWLLGEARSRLNVPLRDLGLAVTVPLAYALTNTYVKKRFHSTPALPLSCLALAMGGAMLLPLTLGFETVRTREHLGEAMAALLLLGVVCTGIAYFAFYRLVQSRGPLFAGMASYVIPLVAIAWGWLDRESVTLSQMLAVGGVLGAVAMVQWRPGRSAGVVGEK